MVNALGKSHLPGVRRTMPSVYPVKSFSCLANSSPSRWVTSWPLARESVVVGESEDMTRGDAAPNVVAVIKTHPVIEKLTVLF